MAEITFINMAILRTYLACRMIDAVRKRFSKNREVSKETDAVKSVGRHFPFILNLFMAVSGHEQEVCN